MQQNFFSFESSELPKKTETSSYCSSVQERLVTYGSEALNGVEHLGLTVGSQSKAFALLLLFAAKG
jgi:hypothetical protein